MPPAAPEVLAPVAQALAHAGKLLARAPALAVKQARAILDAVPGHPEATLILGSALRQQGDYPGARDVLQALARTQPRSAQTQYELALTWAALGEQAAAMDGLRRCTALAPLHADAWRTLGDMLTLAGDAEGADAAYARHIRAAVHDPELIRAADALCQGQLDIAERALKARLKQHPTDVAAIRMLGEAAMRLGRYRDAEALLARCVQLAPSFVGARHNYATVLYRQGKAEEAIPHIEFLLGHDARDPSYRNLMAAAQAMIGEFGKSIEIYENVLKEYPRQPKVWLSYGHALKTSGRRDDSIRAYRTCIDIAPSMGEAYWSLANLKTSPFTGDDIAAMRAQLTQDTLSAEDRFHLHYALGRALEDAAAWADSFTHYAEGARLRRAELRYDAAETSAKTRGAQAFFTADFLASRAGAGCLSDAPIFIVGLPRSGSTLIEQILASHSAVEGTMELPELALISRALAHESPGNRQYPEALAELALPMLAELGERFLARTRIHRKLGRRCFIDKMPNNFVHVGLIQLILPNAKIVDARRNAMATGFSVFKQHFARGQNFSYDLVEIGRYYRDYVALMAHFDAVLPGRVHRVMYEDMVQNTEAEVRRLLDYCGLAFEPACLRFHENDRAVRTASSEQVRQPIFREGIDHWRHYEPFLGELAAALNQDDVLS